MTFRKIFRLFWFEHHSDVIKNSPSFLKKAFTAAVLISFAFYIILIAFKLEIPVKLFNVLHWNYNTNRDNMLEKFLYKILLNSVWLWSRARLAINNKKPEIFLVTRPSTCWEPDSCFWFVRKDKNSIKANF